MLYVLRGNYFGLFVNDIGCMVCGGNLVIEELESCLEGLVIFNVVDGVVMYIM